MQQQLYKLPVNRWYNKIKDNHDDHYSTHHPHDVGYKFLLSSKRAFIELLRSFVKEDWVDFVEESRLIRVEKPYILPGFEKREADRVYRILINDKEIYFFVLLELQSTVDHLMPWRLLEYQVGIWRDVLNNPVDIIPGQKAFRLPAISAIVIENGTAGWTARTNFREMLSESDQLGNRILDFEYLVIDVNRYSARELTTMGNLISSVFLLDQSKNIKDIYNKLLLLRDTIKHLDPESFHRFAKWIEGILVQRVSGTDSNSVTAMLEQPTPKEVDQMISRVGQMIDKELEETRNKGFLEGLLKGQLEGKLEEKKETARKMLSKRMSVEEIVELTELPIEEVKKLKA